MTTTPADFQEFGGYIHSGMNVSQVYVSTIQAFGFPDETFGYDGEFHFSESSGLDSGGTMPQGPLPGLLI